MDSPVLTVATFKWRPPPGYRSKFPASTVNTLKNMVARNYPHPHQFICVTDDPAGLDGDVFVEPIWSDYASVPNPSGSHNPSCYRRLKIFDPAIEDVLGPRFVTLDLDTVVVGDLSPLWNRDDDVVFWGDTAPKTWYNGSMILMSAGARPQVWTEFDPKISPMLAKRSGNFGSDQGWIGYKLGPGEKTWGKEDGVYSYRVHIYNSPLRGRLPPNARIVFFHGKNDPWDPVIARRHDWIQEHYR